MIAVRWKALPWVLALCLLAFSLVAANRLLHTLEDWLRHSLGMDERPKLTGRCFRKGLASSMAARGASIPDMMAAGRWRASAMPARYATEESKQHRAEAASRSLGAAAFSLPGRSTLAPAAQYERSHGATQH